MKKFAVIGESLSHSFSPILHKIIYQKLELNADYSKVEIAPKDLSSFIMSNQFNGLNITIPYKEKVISALDRIDKPSKIIGAITEDQLLFISSLIAGFLMSLLDLIGSSTMTRCARFDVIEPLNPAARRVNSSSPIRLIPA